MATAKKPAAKKAPAKKAAAKKKGQPAAGSIELYNLASDIGETTNLADKESEYFLVACFVFFNLCRIVGNYFINNFADGILIAAAFLADPQVGILTAVAIALHEIPQEVGDFIVLLNAGFTKVRALVYNLISSLMAVIGGVLGYFFLDKAEALIPYVIVFASSSFIYIAVSDLMPQMHRRPKLRESIEQVALIILGVVLVLSIAELGHINHAH